MVNLIHIRCSKTQNGTRKKGKNEQEVKVTKSEEKREEVDFALFGVDLQLGRLLTS